MIPKKTPLLLLASALMIGASASATDIYRNTTVDLLSRLPIISGNIVGDEINFAPGTSRILTNFSFQYWALHNGTAPGNFTPDMSVRVRFYLNDGPIGISGYRTPSLTPFYESTEFFFNAATDRSTLNYTLGTDFGVSGLFIPTTAVFTNITWAVQFGGGTSGDTAGLDVFGPPSVGSSFNDYWQFSGGTWNLLTNTIPMNFAAQFQAGTVPEPSTVVLGVLGGLGFLVFGRRFVKAGK